VLRSVVLAAFFMGCWGTSPSTPPSVGTGADPAVTAQRAPDPSSAAPRLELPVIEDFEQITDAELQGLADLLIPYVERAAGASFRDKPRALRGDTQELGAIVASETRMVLDLIYDLPDHAIDRMASGADAPIMGLLGKYAPATGAVYLVPSTVASLGEDQVQRLEAAAIILAHELAHALQDQVAGTEASLKTLQDYDHFDGWRGITEGHANWVTLRVAREVGLEDAFWRTSRAQGWGPDGLIEPAMFQIFMLYGQGMAMAEHHAAKGGPDRLWEILRAPPRSTTMLFRPERYAPAIDGQVELSGVLRGIEQLLTAGIPWVPADTILGEGALRQGLIGLPAERVDSALAGIEWGFERRFFHQGGGSAGARSAAVRVLQFRDATSAVAVLDLLTEGLDAQARARTELEVELAKVNPDFRPRVWSVEAHPYDKVQGDRVVLQIVGPTSPSGARLSREEEQALWVVRGRRATVVSVSGFRPGNRLDRAVVEIFERLEPHLGEP